MKRAGPQRGRLKSSVLSVQLFPSVQRRPCVEVGFLSINIPITQVLQRDPLARHGAQHEAAGLDDLEVGIKVAKLGFAGLGTGGERIHGRYMPPIGGEVKAHIGALFEGDCLKLDLVPAGGLGAVKRIVGALQQRIHRVFRRNDGGNTA
jgi:hypothetical protein